MGLKFDLRKNFDVFIKWSVFFSGMTISGSWVQGILRPGTPSEP